MRSALLAHLANAQYGRFKGARNLNTVALRHRQANSIRIYSFRHTHPDDGVEPRGALDEQFQPERFETRLQRGRAGQAIAVQNFIENLMMLGMVGLYTGLMHAGVHPVTLATVFGGVVFVGIGTLAALRMR